MFLTQVRPSCPSGRRETLLYLQGPGLASAIVSTYVVSKVKLGCTNQPADSEEKEWVISCQKVL